MTSFGAGLLIGAALVVIIPEGVELLMKDGEREIEEIWRHVRYSFASDNVCGCWHHR